MVRIRGRAVAGRETMLSPRGALIAALTVVLCAFAVPAAEALGCPNCKDALTGGDPEGANLARGYFYSILIMLAMPFALVSSFGAYVWREMRRQKRAGAGASNPPLP
jgi:hypothetical protein